MDQFVIILNDSEEDVSVSMEIWHRDKKITAYVEPYEVSVLQVDGQRIEESDNLYRSLKWLLCQE